MTAELSHFVGSKSAIDGPRIKVTGKCRSHNLRFQPVRTL